MKKILTVALFLCCFQFCFSQNFYEIKWKTESGINYTALVEFFEKENIKVRVNYTTKQGTYKVAKYKCIGKYHYNEDGTKYFVFDGENAEIVYTSSEDDKAGYSADNFVFKNVDANNEFEKLYTYDDQDLADGKLDNVKDATFKKLDPSKDFTSSYINSFFWKTEPEYTTYTSLVSTTSTSSTSTSTTSSSSSTPKFYRLKFRNKCAKPVKVLIRYLDFNDTWKSKGWWEIDTDKTVYVEDSPNSIFYYYAKTTDGKLVWSDKDNLRDFNGTNYGFRKLEKSNRDYGSWITDITCSSYTNTNTSVTTTNTSSSTGTTTGNQFNKDVKLHLIMVADTNDPQIGSSVQQDLNDVTNLFQKASREIGIKYEISKLYGTTFDKSSIMAKINSLGIKSNDVVIFYYSGHGYNDISATNRFPNMSLDGTDLGLESIHQYIKSKGARLNITVGDLCNSIPRTREGTKSDEEIPFKSGFLFDEDKLKRLFIYSKGSLISTSSSKGEWSFCMTNSNGNMGNGHFTNAFINSFAKEASKVNDNNGSWSTMFSRAYQDAKSNTRYIRNQNGQYGQSGFNYNTITYN